MFYIRKTHNNNMRGQQVIYQSLFGNTIIPKPQNQGKRNVFLDKRDEALVHRYYYYVSLLQFQYDNALLKLQDEFFITPGTVTERITANVAQLKVIAHSKPSIETLRKKYPHYTWLSISGRGTTA